MAGLRMTDETTAPVGCKDLGKWTQLPRLHIELSWQVPTDSEVVKYVC